MSYITQSFHHLKTAHSLRANRKAGAKRQTKLAQLSGAAAIAKELGGHRKQLKVLVARLRAL